METANYPLGRSCRSWRPTSAATSLRSARRPQPGPALPGPFHCPGGMSGGRKTLDLCLQLLPPRSPRPRRLAPPPSRTPIKALSRPGLRFTLTRRHRDFLSPRGNWATAEREGQVWASHQRPHWSPPGVPNPGTARLVALSTPPARPRKPIPGCLKPAAPRKHQAVAFLRRFNTKALAKLGRRNS